MQIHSISKTNAQLYTDSYTIYIQIRQYIIFVHISPWAKILAEFFLDSCGHKARSKYLPHISCDASIPLSYQPPSPPCQSELKPRTTMMWGLSGLCLAFIFVQVNKKLVLIILLSLNWISRSLLYLLSQVCHPSTGKISRPSAFRLFLFVKQLLYSVSSQVPNCDSMGPRQQTTTWLSFSGLSGPPCSCPPPWLQEGN